MNGEEADAISEVAAPIIPKSSNVKMGPVLWVRMCLCKMFGIKL